MKKKLKIKKLILYLIMLMLSTFFMSNNAKAESIYIGDYVKPTYYYKHKKGNYISYQTSQYIIRRSDGAFVYCVQPLLRVDENANYQVTESDIELILNITTETRLLLSKIAYYGYGYTDISHNHNNSKWYVATQMLIWQTVDPSVESYFTSSLNGTKNDSILKNEMNEIMDLVNNHSIYPNFKNIPSVMNIGDSVNIIDTNNVLSLFDLNNVNGGLVTKNGNDLTITATEVGNISFNLEKLLNRYGEPTKLYFATNAQSVINRGNLDPIKINFNIKVIGGRVTINKVDSGTLKPIPEGNASLKGALYGIYKTDGTKIGELVTDSNGVATSDYLPELGNYYLQEITPSKGYKIDPTRYDFTISADNLNPTIQVKEQVIKNRIKILKQYDYVDGTTQFLNAESGIVFEIYNSNNVKYSEIITDKNGYAEIELPYGVYKFHQKNTNTGFEKIYDFFVIVDENSEEMQYYNILNNKIAAYLQVLKVDSETGKTIAIKDTTFKILNTDTNQYVSQYVGGEVYSEFKTNDKGIMTTYLKLEAGNYKLIEVSSPFGYLLSQADLSFSIGDGTKYNYTTYGAFVIIQFENKPIKGQIEIHKKGESFIIGDGNFTYEEKPLKNVTYEIYAKENILSSDKQTLYYKKGQLVDRITTDEFGYAISKKLYLGTYYLVEVETDKEHILDSKEYVFTLKEVNNTTPIVYESYSAINYLKKGTIEFTKTDLVTGEVIPNTIIEIYTEDNKLIYIGKTDEKGKIVIDNLKVGKYYIIEKEPSTGYVLTEEEVFFELKENGEIVKAEMKNKPIIGSLEFTKTDLTTGVPLANTIIEIYNKQNELVFIGTTDINGKIIVPELRYGEYYIIEKEATTGYVITDTIVYFKINEDGKIVKANMTNEKIKSIVKIHKVDSKGNILVGVEIGIFDINGNLIGSYLTDINGNVEVELEYGKYYYQELNTIDGYILNDEKVYFDVVEDGAVIEKTLINKEIEIDVPDTFKNDYLNITLIMIIIANGVVLYYEISKTKKKK